MACIGINGIKRGTTTFFDHHESQGVQKGVMDVIEKAVREVGARASLSLGVSDRYGKGKDGIKENIRFIEKINKHKKLTKDELIEFGKRWQAAGMLSKKIDRQPKKSIIGPPITGPKTAAAANETDHNPKACARSLPCRKVTAKIAMAVG